MTERKSASEYIENLKFTKDNLIVLGEKMGIRILRKNTKAKIINIIVEKTVGNRLDIEGLRKGIMG